MGRHGDSTVDVIPLLFLFVFFFLPLDYRHQDWPPPASIVCGDIVDQKGCKWKGSIGHGRIQQSDDKTTAIKDSTERQTVEHTPEDMTESIIA